MDHNSATKLRAVLDVGTPTGDDIRYCLQLRGHSLTDVARAAGVKPETVYAVIHRGATSYNVASTIAALLEQPLHRLWPDGRYDRPPRRRPAA